MNKEVLESSPKFKRGDIVLHRLGSSYMVLLVEYNSGMEDWVYDCRTMSGGYVSFYEFELKSGESERSKEKE